MATTTKTPKMTKASAFAIALELVEKSNHPDKALVVEKISKEIENLSKKNGTAGKPTKAQQENAATATALAEFMANHSARLFTITELSKECPAVLGLSSQKIRPLMTSLIKQNLVERTENKGKALFQYVGEDED